MNLLIRAMFGEVLESKQAIRDDGTVCTIVLEEDKLHMLLETSVNNLRRQF